MFGPNNTPSIHHREPAFKILYRDLVDTFKEKFNLQNYIVLPITGSGTLSTEILLKSLNLEYIPEFTEDEFGRRLAKFSEMYTNENAKKAATVFVQYETSTSRFQEPDFDFTRYYCITDCVSSFPYYDVPDEVNAFITVNSKQLGASPGLSFICIKPSIIKELNEEEFSYLSLMRYIRYSEVFMTPNTPCISIMQETLERLKKFNLMEFRKRIDSRRKRLEEIIPEDDIIGTGPVFSTTYFTEENIKELNLYHKGSCPAQIFLWSNSDDDFNYLIDYVLEENYKRKNNGKNTITA